MPGKLMYDRAEALAQLGGDEELLFNISQVFVAECDEYCLALQRATTDACSLQREAHTVKSLFATFYCETGRAQAARLEQLAATGELDVVPGGMGELVAKLVATIRQLSMALKKEVASS